MNARLFALLLSLPLCALAAKPSAEPPGSGKYYKTPQAVFDASEKAASKKDYKTVIDCVAPEGRKELAADMAAQAIIMKTVEGPGVEKALKSIKAVMVKHGLTDKAVSSIKIEPVEVASLQKARAALGKLIKKPDAVAVEMMAAQARFGEGVARGLPKLTTKLLNVKVEGKKASGMMVVDYGGAQLRQKIS